MKRNEDLFKSASGEGGEKKTEKRSCGGKGGEERNGGGERR